MQFITGATLIDGTGAGPIKSHRALLPPRVDRVPLLGERGACLGSVV